MSGIPSRIDTSTEAPAVRRGLLSSGGQARRWLDAALDLIFPPRCILCGKLDTRWCARCQRALDLIPLATEIRDCQPLEGVAYTALHGGKLQQAIHALKYEGAALLAEPLGKRLAARLETLQWTFDMIVPVPLYRSRELWRGYNQAKLLAQAAAAHVMMPYDLTALSRQRETTSQVGLNGAQRRANVQDAFHGDAAILSGRAILLIDDVFTTGATLGACAQAALNAGAHAVYGLTVTSAH
jgi:ComF family protein